MNDAAIKAFVALIPVCALFTGATMIFVRRRSMSSFLQLVGAAGLVAVILTHVFEGLRVFPGMGWRSQHSWPLSRFAVRNPGCHAVFSRILDSRSECERERGNCTRASGRIAKLGSVPI